MYGNPFLNSNQYSYVTDKPQHIMYGNRAKKKQEQISQQG